jgi:hypothetical protein
MRHAIAVFLVGSVTCIALACSSESTSAPDYVDPTISTGTSGTVDKDGGATSSSSGSSSSTSGSSSGNGSTSSSGDAGADSGSSQGGGFRLASDSKAAAAMGSDTSNGLKNVGCPAGSVATGLVVKVGGGATDGVGLRCSPLDPVSGKLGQAVNGELANTGMDANDNIDCPNDMVLTELQGASRGIFGLFKIGCRTLVPWAKGEPADQSIPTKVIGRIVWTPPFQRPDEQKSACDEGGIITRLEVGLGRFNQFQVVGRVTPFCQELIFE